MKLQLLSDLHLETEDYHASPASGAELLVVAGDVDSHWTGLDQFRDWPVPVLFVAGNHEFDRRDFDDAGGALRERCVELGVRLLERETAVVGDAVGRRIRFLGTTRWSDFDLFGAAGRERAMKAGGYFTRIMRTTRHGTPFDAPAIRDEALRCRAWLETELRRRPDRRAPAPTDAAEAPCDDTGVASRAGPSDWDRTVVVTHFAPSLKSADPRYGRQPSTASFCNADDDLLAYADLWLHGHLHCPLDYRVDRAGGSTRVVCNPLGQARKGESAAHRPHLVLDV